MYARAHRCTRFNVQDPIKKKLYLCGCGVLCDGERTTTATVSILHDKKLVRGAIRLAHNPQRYEYLSLAPFHISQPILDRDIIEQQFGVVDSTWVEVANSLILGRHPCSPLYAVWK